jgi:hypothetical protein
MPCLAMLTYSCNILLSIPWIVVARYCPTRETFCRNTTFSDNDAALSILYGVYSAAWEVPGTDYGVFFETMSEQRNDRTDPHRLYSG